MRRTDPGSPPSVRTIVVPPDIVAVRRTSPLPVRKRTPWRPRPEGVETTRGGTREWFSEQIFTTAHQPHIRAACGTSMTAHVCCLAAVVVVLVARPSDPPQIRAGPPLVMPAILATVTLPSGPLAPSPAPPKLEPPKPARVTPAPPPPLPTPAASLLDALTTAPAPVEAPAGITAETGAESASIDSAGGVEGGVTGGAGGGVIGGQAGGFPSGDAAASAPRRVGGGIEPPRKIKDVRPVYPAGALSDQSRGTVVIEAVVDIDGRVSDARVLQSVPALDEAALVAVRQWEFVPSRLNGAPVAVIITVIVQFTIH